MPHKIYDIFKLDDESKIEMWRSGLMNASIYGYLIMVTSDKTLASSVNVKYRMSKVEVDMDSYKEHE